MREFTGKVQVWGERSFHMGERSDIPTTIASRLPAGLASCTLPADGWPRPFQRASCTDQIVTEQRRGKTRNRSVLKGLLSFSCSGYLISGLKQDVGMIQACAPFAFRSGSRASVFVRIPVITSTRFTTTIRRKWRWRARKITPILLRAISSRIVVPETRVGVFIRFGRGVCRDSRSHSLHLRSAQLGANT